MRRFVEVRGRIAGADQFMVTRNEILHAPQRSRRLAAGPVEVSPDGAVSDQVRHLRQPFRTTVHLLFDTTATVLSWPDDWDSGEAPS